MDDHLPAKRPRTRSDSPTRAQVQRSPVWYSDGSVVLQAETTQFRVHISILSAASTVFKDMLEVAQAVIKVESKVDGCPVVQLSDDKAEDVEIVLLALYDRNFDQSHKKTFIQVSAMWRLGTKYGFDELRDDALCRLEYIFPASWSTYSLRYYYAGCAPPIQCPIYDYPGFVFDAVNLARTANIMSILPAALYRAGATHQSHDVIIGNVLNGLPRVDGELAQMSDKDKTICIVATFSLMRKQWGNFDVWLEAVGQEGRCIHPELACRRTPKVVKAHYRGSPVSHVPPLAYNIDHFYGLANLCPPCEVSVRMRLHETLETLWAELPSVFGLPPWEDIEQEMARFRPSPTEE
ncbi:hypothetical protein DFH06DRAFT_1247331 [Mycena polygramma]|nr:hypothetical protein DFH06DRAFT_1247331 [Mycena polygramma]